MTAPPAGALEACLALLVEQMDMLRDDFVSYSEGKATVPFVVLRDALVAALNAYDAARPALLAALRLREWRPIESAPWDEVVLLCDANGNRWTDCAPGHPANGCGMPAIAFMPLPAPPTADDLARVLEDGE